VNDPTLRVVVADDHPFYRQGLVRSLEASGMQVVAEAPNGEAALRAAEETAPDVVVMDLKMPGVSGLEATRRLVARAPASRILALSVSVDQDDVTEAILAGATGYVLKDSPVEEVIAGIHAAAAGEAHVSAEVATPLLRQVCVPVNARLDLAGVPLSSRERQVLDLLRKGRTDREIADELGIDRGSVGEDASSIVMKLQVESRLYASLRASRAPR
jgi:DNA-binding NarL/FixJ family response regulator